MFVKVKSCINCNPQIFADLLMKTRSLLQNASISGMELVVLGGIIKTEDFWDLQLLVGFKQFIIIRVNIDICSDKGVWKICYVCECAGYN